MTVFPSYRPHAISEWFGKVSVMGILCVRDSVVHKYAKWCAA